MKLQLIGLALAACAMAGQAQTHEFRFVGTVDQGSPMAPAGSTVTGTFAYDPTAKPDMLIGKPAGHVYGQANYIVPSAMTARVNGHTLTSTVTVVDVVNNFGGNIEDSVSVYSQSPMVLDGTPFPEGSFGFYLGSGWSQTKVLGSTALPRRFSLQQFDGANYGWALAHGRSDGSLLSFVITQVTPVHHKGADRD